MKLVDILNEKIYIDSPEHDKLHAVIEKWLANLRIQYAEDLDSYNNINSRVLNDYEKMVEPLRKSMLPTIRHMIKPYLPSDELLQKHYANKEQHYKKMNIPWKPEHGLDYFLGHKLSMGIYGYDTPMHGSVGNWSPSYVGKRAERKHKLINDIDLNIKDSDLARILFYPNESIIDSWVATLTHEITHLIQGLKSSHQSVSGHSLSGKNGGRESYLSLPYEIDAFAQSVASKILSDAKKYPNPLININSAIMGIRMGVQELFGRPFFKGPEYTEFKNMFKVPSDDPKVNTDRQRVWRTFQKALIAKLIKYKEQLS